MTNKERPIVQSDEFIEHAMADFGNAVYRLAIAHTRSRQDAEDVYQDVFICLAQEKRSFASRDHVKAWLLRVTVNRCRDLGRTAWRRRTASIDTLPFEPAESSPESSEESRRLREAFDALPDDLRAMVHLHYFEGYKTGEIAKILGMNHSTLRNRLRVARRQLKSALGGAEDEEKQKADDRRALRGCNAADPCSERGE